MKTSLNCKNPPVIVKTITILEIAQPLPQTLQVGLSYAAAPYWVSGSNLYILNCALADAVNLCQNAKKEVFLWGKPGGRVAKYQAQSGKMLEYVPDDVIPDDYMAHAVAILDEGALARALDENRTFLSRAQHRRAAQAAIKG